MLSKKELEYVEDPYFFEIRHSKRYTQQLRYRIRVKAKKAIEQLEKIALADHLIQGHKHRNRSHMFPFNFCELIVKLLSKKWIYLDVNAIWQLLMEYPHLRKLTERKASDN